jgi:hypothetical protein
MIFIITGEGERGPVSSTCQTPIAALQKAQTLADEGVRNVLIDADGREYAPRDFDRRFVQPAPIETE